MKKIYLIAILIITYATSASGQEGWIKQTSPSSLGLLGVYAIDSLDVWAVGEEGLIIHTIDGGNTWDSIPSGTTDLLITVEFINADTGWVGGSTSENETRIYRTTDGGLNWESQILNAGQDLNVWDVDFIEGPPGEPMRGYVASGLGHVFYTYDYGETWEALSGQCGESNFWSCYMLDSITGWFVGMPSNTNPYTIMFTEDGGNNFNEQINPKEVNLRAVSFGTKEKGIAAGFALLFTSDGGETWEESTYQGTYRYESVFLNETGKAWLVGNNGWVAYSDDWGQTWEKQQSGVSGNTELQEVFFIDDNKGWIVGRESGQPGVILHTKNGGYSTPSMIDEALSESITLYPNPVSDILNIESDFRLTKVEIYTIVGGKVKEIITDFSTIQTGHLSKGIYILKIHTEKGIATKKFTKE